MTRRIINTPQLARQWKRRDESKSYLQISLSGRHLIYISLAGIHHASNVVAEWHIDTRKGGEYERLSCFTSFSLPIRPTPATSRTKLPESPITEAARSLPAAVVTGADNSDASTVWQIKQLSGYTV